MITFSLDSSTMTGTLTLSGSFAIQHAQSLHEALLKAVNKVKRLVINMERVETLDLTTLQLLCAAHRSLLKSGKTLELDGTVPAIVNQIVRESGFVDCTGKNDVLGFWTGEIN